jgi:hypothetical protein
MRERVALVGVFLSLTFLPASVRALDLSGESLVAQAPSETIIAASTIADSITTSKSGDMASRPARVRQEVWDEYGRGIDFSKWRFHGARFDRATMARMRLVESDLRMASFDYTNLIGQIWRALS